MQEHPVTLWQKIVFVAVGFGAGCVFSFSMFHVLDRLIELQVSAHPHTHAVMKKKETNDGK